MMMLKKVFVIRIHMCNQIKRELIMDFGFFLKYFFLFMG